MSSKQSTVDFILEQMALAPLVSAKKMFGEYGIYSGDKMVALVCDDQLFIKPTSGGRLFAGKVEEAPPYPGARNCLLISGERWDDREWLSGLVRITAKELPPSKTTRPRKPRK